MSAQEPLPERLGEYRLLRRIGEGGMGVVFLARGSDGHAVALKVLREAAAGEPTARQRLAREVETMRRVRSPHVAEVIDADLAGGTPYIVTRYVPGRTLDEVITTDGPLRGQDLARLACGLAQALAAVHAAGVVHRDLKPGNVMMLDGAPVVIDFGIAQAPDATRLTLTGMFMGTPGYLPPEVIEGRPSNEAADVHAWGATVAFAATGRPPFGTGPYEAVFYRIVNSHPDLAGAPAVLLPLLASAMAREPAHRPGAASLSTQAASLDPAALVPETAATVAQPVIPSQGGPPATRGDMVPAAGGYAGHLAGVPVDAPVTAADGVAAGPAPPGTRPLRPGELPADDFADVLTPVEYQPERAPVPEAAPGPPDGAPPARARGAARARWHPLLVLAAMVAAVGASVILPVVGTLTALTLIVLLRAGELARQRSSLRRLSRGARTVDPLLSTLAFPWFLLRSLGASLLLAPLALVVAAVVGGITIAAMPGHPVPRALAFAAGALVAFYGLGPGSGRSRRQLNRIFATAVRGRLSQLVAAVGMVSLAAATLAAALSWPSYYWPTGVPGGLHSLANLSHLGLAAHLLVFHRHGW